MANLRLYLLIVILCPVILFAQNDSTNNNNLQEALFYKKIYAYADSINKTENSGTLDKTVFTIAASCDSLHPQAYYEKAVDEMMHSHFNEAAFLYNLGNLRYGYYNAVNPNYQASEDGASAGSLSYRAGELIKIYLHTNVYSFVATLNASLNWFTSHDYAFFSKNNDSIKYQAQINELNSAVAFMVKNKLQLQAAFEQETKQMEKAIDEYISQMKKTKSK